MPKLYLSLWFWLCLQTPPSTSLWNIVKQFVGWEGFSFVVLLGFAIGLLQMNKFRIARGLFAVSTVALAAQLMSSSDVYLPNGWAIHGKYAAVFISAVFLVGMFYWVSVEAQKQQSPQVANTNGPNTKKRDFLVERLTDFTREAGESSTWKGWYLGTDFLPVPLWNKIEKFLKIHLPNEVARFKKKGIDGVEEIISELLAEPHPSLVTETPNATLTESQTEANFQLTALRNEKLALKIERNTVGFEQVSAAQLTDEYRKVTALFARFDYQIDVGMVYHLDVSARLYVYDLDGAARTLRYDGVWIMHPWGRKKRFGPEEFDYLVIALVTDLGIATYEYGTAVDGRGGTHLKPVSENIDGKGFYVEAKVVGEKPPDEVVLIKTLWFRIEPNGEDTVFVEVPKPPLFS